MWGMNTVTCYMNACRSYTEPEARKLVARVLVLFAMDDRAGSLASIFEKLSASTETRFAASISVKCFIYR